MKTDLVVASTLTGEGPLPSGLSPWETKDAFPGFPPSIEGGEAPDGFTRPPQTSALITMKSVCYFPFWVVWITLSNFFFLR